MRRHRARRRSRPPTGASKLTDDAFLALPYGIGIKQGNTALKRWVDSRLELMRKKDLFMADPAEQRPGAVRAGFSKNILRPNNTFGYAPRREPERGHGLPVERAGTADDDPEAAAHRAAAPACLR